MNADNAMDGGKIKTKDLLIQAGIRELSENGLQNFSIRRIASECGLSCAAPYKHFRNSDEFVLAIFRYVNKKWHMRQNEILTEVRSARGQLTEICVEYVRFMAEYPNHFTLVTMPFNNLTEEQRNEKNAMSACVTALLRSYCETSGMSEAVCERKTRIIRAFIYGAALMVINGVLPDADETYLMIRNAISREFDID